MEVDAAPARDPLRCLVVSDGRRGIENQALGLAEAVARVTTITIQTVHLPRSGAVAAPPGAREGVDLWIGCGRAARRAARAHKAALPGARFVYVQDPRADYDVFDLIVAPRHDRLSGRNVLPILGSPNRITPERLSEGEAEFSETLASLPRPRVAVLLGGDSKHHRFNETTCANLLETVERIAAQAGSVMITPSRRSPASFRTALAERFGGKSNVWLHHGDGPNPYFAFLSAADWICVTEDSTNMLCEAASAGKPVYRLLVDGKPGKFRRLYAGLEGEGAVRPFLGELERWAAPGLDETGRAANALLEILGLDDEVKARSTRKESRS